MVMLAHNIANWFHAPFSFQGYFLSKLMMEIKRRKFYNKSFLLQNKRFVGNFYQIHRNK